MNGNKEVPYIGAPGSISLCTQRVKQEVRQEPGVLIKEEFAAADDSSSLMPPTPKPIRRSLTTLPKPSLPTLPKPSLTTLPKPSLTTLPKPSLTTLPKPIQGNKPTTVREPKLPAKRKRQANKKSQDQSSYEMFIQMNSPFSNKQLNLDEKIERNVNNGSVNHTYNELYRKYNYVIGFRPHTPPDTPPDTAELINERTGALIAYRFLQLYGYNDSEATRNLYLNDSEYHEAYEFDINSSLQSLVKLSQDSETSRFKYRGITFEAEAIRIGLALNKFLNSPINCTLIQKTDQKLIETLRRTPRNPDTLGFLIPDETEDNLEGLLEVARKLEDFCKKFTPHKLSSAIIIAH